MYLSDHAYGVVEHDDLWAAFQLVADDEDLRDQNGERLKMKEILDTWILQMGAYEQRWKC